MKRGDTRTARPAAKGIWLAAVLPLAAGGCLGSYEESVRTVSSVDQAAGVLVTPTMVRPWRDVADALAPNFALSGDAAVAKVLPTTERVQDQVLRALGLSLGVGLPGSSTTSTTTITGLAGDKSTTDATGVTTSTSSAENQYNSASTASRTAGVVPAVPTGAPAGATLPPSGAPTGDLGIDPVLQYKAANYLYQSVQLLNREVQAAAQRSCYEPYVVKLKLAVMPYRRNLGYDLHTRIGFFPNTEKNPYGPLSQENAPAFASIRATEACKGLGHVPVAVPLLAADDLQMAVRAKAIEEAQQIGLALNAMVSGVGVAAGANRLNQTLRGILNHDLSSSLTVSRETDNTLYVKIAANNAASGEPSLVGQTYDVAVLLLIPRRFFAEDTATTVAVTTYTEFRNAFDGSVLARRSEQALVARATGLLIPFLQTAAQRDVWTGVGFDDQLAFIRRVSGPLQRGDYAAFLTAVAGPVGHCGAPCAGPAVQRLFEDDQAFALGQTLWTALSAVNADSAFKSSVVELPRPAPITTAEQDIFLQDDGKEVATAVVSGLGGYTAGSLKATLRITPLDAAGKAQSLVVVPAQAMAFDPAMQALTLTFPSLAKLGLRKTSSSGSSLELALAPCDRARRLCPALNGAAGAASYAVRVVAASAAAAKSAGFSLTAATPTIVIQKNSEGLGHAALKITKLATGRAAVLSTSGAEVLSVVDASGAIVPTTIDGHQVNQNGTYTFAFRGLRDDATVTITGQETSNGAKVGTTLVNLRATSR